MSLGQVTYEVLDQFFSGKIFPFWWAMSKLYLHHVLIAVDDLERAREFYTKVLEMQEIDRPHFDYPGIWYKIGDGEQQLHILVRSDAMLRRDKWIDFDDIHFALRVESYRNTLTWLREKGFREDLPDDDFRKMKLRSKSIAGYTQIYIIDPDRNIIEFNCETTA
jgi:glyoxylase I family protein